MTVPQAERIIGFDIDLEPSVEKFVGGQENPCYEATANWEHGTALVRGKSREEACQKLVDEIYRQRSHWVMRKQRFRCAECGKINPLEIDHIVPRSRGRDDRISNLRAVCASFTGCRIHERKHHG